MKIILPGFSGLNAAAKRTQTGSLALQLMNGAMKMVKSRSRFDSRMRVDMMAGTEQPNPTSIGTNDLPGSPIQRMKRSITNAARDM